MQTTGQKSHYTLGPLRPPSEDRSLLIRVTKNCPWNRCKFCRGYKGQKFALKTLDQVRQEILAIKEARERLEAGGRPANTLEYNVANWLYGGSQSVFLQDADTLIMPVDELVEVITFLRQTFPRVSRVTTYGRSSTAARRSIEDLVRLRQAGLSRIHIGLESGYDPLLAFMKKGTTAEDHIRGGRNVVAAGISLSVYVLLGLAGSTVWREHALETARVVNEINPDYIRLRTLVVTDDMPLYNDLASGSFVRMTDEQVIEEEKLFIQNLDCHAALVSDHPMDLLTEIEGQLPADKTRIMAVINRFQSLDPVERGIFRMGRRLGIYYRLDDLDDPDQSEAIERTMAKFGHDPAKSLDESIIYGLMERTAKQPLWYLRTCEQAVPPVQA